MARELVFLGYDERRTRLIGAIRERGWAVVHSRERVMDLSGWDLAVSFGYRHLLAPETLATARRPPLNLHIAFLPWNRGAHPNFWSHIEGTPAGVTIHEIDAGLDTGPICFQRHVTFAPSETTFDATHARLVAEAEALFLGNIDALLSGGYTAQAQTGEGGCHAAKDLPAWMDDWGMEIAAAKTRWAAERGAG